MTPTEPPTCANGKQHDCGRSHRKAIIGGAIGAGVVVVLGLVGLWLWRSRAESEATLPPEEIGPEVQELADPGPELQSREDGMLTSAVELPHPVPELQSREDGMMTSAHELPGMTAPGRLLIPGAVECHDTSNISYRY